jgi:hypothetical protein
VEVRLVAIGRLGYLPTKDLTLKPELPAGELELPIGPALACSADCQLNMVASSKTTQWLVPFGNGLARLLSCLRCRDALIWSTRTSSDLSVLYSVANEGQMQFTLKNHACITHLQLQLQVPGITCALNPRLLYAICFCMQYARAIDPVQRTGLHEHSR